MFQSMPPSTILMEACTESGWVARLLGELGHDVIVGNPRTLKGLAKAHMKTDVLDAEMLAREARLMQMDPHHGKRTSVRTRDGQLVRSKLSGREQLMKMRTEMVSHVRSTLRLDAIAGPRCDADNFADAVSEMNLPADVRATIQPLVASIRCLSLQIKELEVQLRDFAQQQEVTTRWLEVPGIGRLTAVSVLLAVEDPRRFARARDAGPFAGLTPRLEQSGNVQRMGRISKLGDARTRTLLVQAALSMMRSKQDCALKAWALKLAARAGTKKAAIGLARKLLVVMVSMWKTGQAFEPFPQMTTAA
jgi:transposase